MATKQGDWLATPLGQRLLETETALLAEAFEGLFGEQFLQLGRWGETEGFAALARTQRATVLTPPAADSPGALDGPVRGSDQGGQSGQSGQDGQSGDCGGHVVGALDRLPVASDSIDVLLLPHTLERCARPHAVLREVDRVLRSDGHLVVLGFKPGGLWGLKRALPGASFPPDASQLISDRRLGDWFRLLDLRIHGLRRYFFRWPFAANAAPADGAWEDLGRRWWPELAACYMLTAQKRTITLIPLRRRWHARPKVAASLVEPTARNLPQPNIARRRIGPADPEPEGGR